MKLTQRIAFITTIVFSLLSLGSTNNIEYKDNQNDFSVVFSYKDLPDYNDSNSDTKTNHKEAIQTEEADQEAASASTGGSSEDADYILKGINDPDSSSFNPYFTPSIAFKRDYGSKSYCDKIKKGDIIFETNCVFYLNGMGHTAIVSSIDKFGYDSSHNIIQYIQTIEAVTGGVQFGFLDDTRIKEFGVVILRPNSSKYASSAVDFCLKQVGKDYNLPLKTGRTQTDVNSDYWYCSELVYAAYYNAGLNLNCIDSYGWCFPYDLFNSYYLNVTNIEEFFDLRLVNKDGNKWKIWIYNSTSNDKLCYYNKKMCFDNDAIKWQNLNDVETITVPKNSYKCVEITENWWATSIAFSFLKTDSTGQTRFITYANSLNSSAKRMSVFKERAVD